MSNRKYSYREQSRRDIIAMALREAEHANGSHTIYPDTPYHQDLKREVEDDVKLFKSLKGGRVLSELEWHHFKEQYAGFLNEIAAFIGRKPYERAKKKVTTLADVVTKAKKKQKGKKRR